MNNCVWMHNNNTESFLWVNWFRKKWHMYAIFNAFVTTISELDIDHKKITVHQINSLNTKCRIIGVFNVVLNADLHTHPNLPWKSEIWWKIFVAISVGTNVFGIFVHSANLFIFLQSPLKRLLNGQISWPKANKTVCCFLILLCATMISPFQNMVYF